jgi:membrane protein DedA with SNARE-associated domain
MPPLNPAQLPIENLEWLGHLGYIALAILIALEGPIATVFGGMAAAAGYMQLALVIVAAVLGNFLADMGWYTLGYVGGFPTLLRYFPRLQEYEAHIELIETEMHTHGIKLLLASKFTLGMASIPTLVAAGMTRVPARRLVPISLGAEILWSGLLVLLGYFLGDYIVQLEQGLQYLTLAGAIVMLFLVLWLYRRIASNFFRPAHGRVSSLEG